MTRQEEAKIDRHIASLSRQSRWLLALAVMVAVAAAVVIALRLAQ